MFGARKDWKRSLVGIHSRIHVLTIMFHWVAELPEIGPRPSTFSYAELRTATENFNAINKLGEGGFGAVYKVSQNFHFNHIMSDTFSSYGN